MNADGVDKAIKPIISSFEVENDNLLINKFKYVAVEIVLKYKNQYRDFSFVFNCLHKFLWESINVNEKLCNFSLTFISI